MLPGISAVLTFINLNDRWVNLYREKGCIDLTPGKKERIPGVSFAIAE